METILIGHSGKSPAGLGEFTFTRAHHAETPQADVSTTPCTHTHGSHSHTHTHTTEVLNRLSRAIGHLNGVRSMVEEGRDCAEVLVQLVAVRSAINAICRVILQDHLDHCVVDAVESGDMQTIEELNKAIDLLIK